jgi:hypothetical protein
MTYQSFEMKTLRPFLKLRYVKPPNTQHNMPEDQNSLHEGCGNSLCNRNPPTHPPTHTHTHTHTHLQWFIQFNSRLFIEPETIHVISVILITTWRVLLCQIKDTISDMAGGSPDSRQEISSNLWVSWKLNTSHQRAGYEVLHSVRISYLAVDPWAFADICKNIFTADKSYMEARIAYKTQMYSNYELQRFIYIYWYQYLQPNTSFLMWDILYRKIFCLNAY